LGWEEVVLWSDDAKQDYLGRLNDKMLSETILNNGLSKREKDILIFLSKGFTMREIGSFLGVSHVRVVKIVGSIREKCQKYADPL
jgi:DNA-directed RNA polymerase specialized sigma subunit